jgi:hypothetical protein
MKIEFSIKRTTPTFDLEKWINDNQPKLKESCINRVRGLYGHYEELLEDFRLFLYSSDKIVDEDGIPMSPIQIYNAIEYYKIRIQKLWLIFGLRLYKTYNVNKETKVRYIVMRAFWIDDFGKPFRKFSKNLGAENKVIVNGFIPPSDLDSVEDYILTLMSDLYYYEYISQDEFGIDENGYIAIIPD